MDESEEFRRIQKLIWEPLVHYYFPNFGKALNIKNWMHVLRRRIKHIKIHNDTTFKIPIPSFVKTLEDQKYIENCEWIYKCPLNVNDMPKSPYVSEAKTCKSCNKNVHIVDDMHRFRYHIEKGHCVTYSTTNDYSTPLAPPPVGGLRALPIGFLPPQPPSH